MIRAPEERNVRGDERCIWTDDDGARHIALLAECKYSRGTCAINMALLRSAEVSTWHFTLKPISLRVALRPLTSPSLLQSLKSLSSIDDSVQSAVL
jgi:hypothetical protein